MKTRFWIRSCSLIPMFFLAAFTAKAKELPFESVRVLKITTATNDGREALLVRGMCLESAFVVTKVKTTAAGKDEVNISVDAGVNLANDKSLTAGFTTKIEKTSDLKKVTYGPNHDVIWRADSKT